MKTANLYTRNQNIGFLVDGVLFSDSLSTKIRAITQLSRDHELDAIPIIEEIVKTLPSTDRAFRTIYTNVIDKLKEQMGHGERVAGRLCNGMFGEKKGIVNSLYLSGVEFSI